MNVEDLPTAAPNGFKWVNVRVTINGHAGEVAGLGAEGVAMSRNPARRLFGRRGFVLGEIIVTCALLALAATLAASMMIRLFETGHALRVDEQTGLKIDAAVAQLRRDVEPSAVGRVKDGTLTTDAATWAVRENSLVRTGRAEQTFGPLPRPIELAGEGNTVALRVGRANWTIAPLNLTGAGQ